jgi:hypothetical protein
MAYPADPSDPKLVHWTKARPRAARCRTLPTQRARQPGPRAAPAAAVLRWLTPAPPPAMRRARHVASCPRPPPPHAAGRGALPVAAAARHAAHGVARPLRAVAARPARPAGLVRAGCPGGHAARSPAPARLPRRASAMWVAVWACPLTPGRAAVPPCRLARTLMLGAGLAGQGGSALVYRSERLRGGAARARGGGSEWGARGAWVAADAAARHAWLVPMAEHGAPIHMHACCDLPFARVSRARGHRHPRRLLDVRGRTVPRRRRHGLHLVRCGPMDP